MKIEADWVHSPASRAVTAMLEDAGHQAFFVGGCVRNALLGVPVTDLDVSTDAPPERVQSLAKNAGLRAIPTGIDHGTITVICDGEPYEITTFRRDVETDGRHAVVAFSDRIEDDAQRRDFTMNALYCDGRGMVHDPLGGLSDLQARHVRFVGEPEARIREDYLRILRFFRFYAWYGQNGLDADGLAACALLSDGIETLAKERVGQEIRKLLAARDPAPSVASMASSGVLMRCLPGAQAAMLPVLVHIEETLGAEPDPMRRLVALGGEDSVANLRLSNAEAKQIQALQGGLGSDMGPLELGYRLGEGAARDVLLLRAAAMAQPIDPAWVTLVARGAGAHFPLSAADVMPAVQGPELGKALKAAERAWIDSDMQLDRDALRRLVLG